MMLSTSEDAGFSSLHRECFNRSCPLDKLFFFWRMFSQPLINEMIITNSSPKIPSKCKHTFRMINARASERREARFAVVCSAPVFNFVFLSLSYKFLKQANVRTVSRIIHLDDEQIENTSSRWAAFWCRFSSTYILLFAL